MRCDPRNGARAFAFASGRRNLFTCSSFLLFRIGVANKPVSSDRPLDFAPIRALARERNITNASAFIVPISFSALRRRSSKFTWNSRPQQPNVVIQIRIEKSTAKKRKIIIGVLSLELVCFSLAYSAFFPTPLLFDLRASFCDVFPASIQVKTLFSLPPRQRPANYCHFPDA